MPFQERQLISTDPTLDTSRNRQNFPGKLLEGRRALLNLSNKTRNIWNRWTWANFRSSTPHPGKGSSATSFWGLVLQIGQLLADSGGTNWQRAGRPRLERLIISANYMLLLLCSIDLRLRSVIGRNSIRIIWVSNVIFIWNQNRIVLLFENKGLF